jgi:uncharacterized protein with von Willebrand factor type A (vWA) domain
VPDPAPIHRKSRENILGFVHHLRAAEFDVTSEDAVLMGRALAAFSIPDIRLSRNACRAVCCRRREEWRRFDELFETYWLNRDIDRDNEIDQEKNEKSAGGTGGLAGIGTGTDVFDTYKRDDAGIGAGAGRQNTIARADFRFLGNRDAMRQVERLAEQLASRLQTRPGRRRKITRRPGQLALRPTLRASVRCGGLPLDPRYSIRKHEPPRLVLLHDVSHSMTFNNPLLFRFTRGLVRRFGTAEAFVFHTRLFRVTPMYREVSLTRMKQRLEENNWLWMGGTCIADSLAEFSARFASSTLRANTMLVIISDGFDSNGPEQLALELRFLKRRCRRLIWLNPMLEREGFNADKEAVWNVRRNVDHLLPAHSLDVLRRCIRAIGE